MTKQDKVQILQDVSDVLKDVNGVVLADFKGMTVAEMEELRKKRFGNDAPVFKFDKP